MSTEILTPVGRIVAGHPMDAQVVKDPKTNVIKLQQDGVTPRVEYYLALAIQKGAEPSWNQTEWGKAIEQVAIAGWPNGEWQAPTFAWKVTDGDSTIPNKKGKKPSEREGWAGHWVLQLSTGLPIGCFHNGKFLPQQAIQNKAEIKRGDYAQVVINAKDNSPSESPGVYLNPTLVNIIGPGVEIVGENAPDAAAAFGGSVATMPAGALVDTARSAPQGQPMTDPNAPAGTAMVPATSTATQTSAPASAPTPAPEPDQAPPPAPEFLKPTIYISGGKQYTKEQLEGYKWTAEQIANCPTL